MRHKRERDGRIKDRIKAVLLRDDGWTYVAIAKALFLTDEGARLQVEDYGQVEEDFESSFQTAFDFLGDPHKLWLSEDIADKKLTLKLVFAKQLPYRRNEGFQTAALSQPFRLTAGLKAGHSGLVDLVRNNSNQLFELLQDWAVVLQYKAA